MKTSEFGCQFPKIMLLFYSFVDQQQKFLPASMEHRKGLGCRDSFNSSQMLRKISSYLSYLYCLFASLIFQPKMSQKKYLLQKASFFFWECDSESLEGGYTGYTTKLATKNSEPIKPALAKQMIKIHNYPSHPTNQKENSY